MLLIFIGIDFTWILGKRLLMKMYGVILLAAGPSTRLGWPKQLLLYRGQSLISQATETAVRSEADMVAVVIGGYATSFFPELEKFPVRMVYNQHFDDGVATSICKGLEALNVYDLDGAVFMSCDQPSVSPALINGLIEKGSEDADSIVACAYSNTVGAPAYFSKKYFPELLQLTGHDGTRKVMAHHKDNVTEIPFPAGVINIDTANDYEYLLAS